MRHESCNVRERGECDDVRERHVCDGAGGSGQDEMSSTKAGMLLATNCPLQATGDTGDRVQEARDRRMAMGAV